MLNILSLQLSSIINLFHQRNSMYILKIIAPQHALPPLYKLTIVLSRKTSKLVK